MSSSVGLGREACVAAVRGGGRGVIAEIRVHWPSKTVFLFLAVPKWSNHARFPQCSV